jgi:membrane protease YdiL (CAAX protease family)
MLAPDEIDPGPAAEPEAHPPLAFVVERWVVLAEMAAVLCLAVLPYTVHSLIYYLGVETQKPGFGIDMLMRTVGSLQVSAPLLYILWRSGQPLATFGLLRPRWFLDAAAALFLVIVIWVVNSVSWGVGYSLLGDAILGGPSRDKLFSLPQSAGDYLGFVIAQTANAFAEELAMRGYLVTRLRQLGASPLLTIALSAGLFGAYHLYQGLWAAFLITLHGVVFAGAFLRLGRLWPVVMAHLFLNLLVFLHA